MLGCDLHCGYCQNCLTSQALRDEKSLVQPRRTSAEELAELAVQTGAAMIASSYNEPLITTEWGAAVMRAGRESGLVTAYVSNGNATPEVLDHLRPLLDCYKVDLKAMRPEHYRALGAKLDNVLVTIEGLKRRGFWVEIVTLLVPGYNDGEAEIRDAARFLVGVDPLIPWHVTAFHPDYRMLDNPQTTADQLVAAAEIGQEEGLRYVYCGNLPGRVGEFEDTRCHSCSATLIRRRGYMILEDLVTPNRGICPRCETAIPGIWSRPAASA
jgi:pyruvate formate lyase activating enzyme